MKQGEVTNLRTGEKTDRFFCLIHPSCHILSSRVPKGDPEAPRYCEGCNQKLVWYSFKFQCHTQGCEYRERWGER